MKTNVVAGVWMGLLFACLAPGAETPSDEPCIKYSYTSFPACHEQSRGDGTWGPPEGRVLFGKEIQTTHGLRVTIAEKSLVCPVIYQDAAHLVDGDKKKPIRVLAYGGCPFQIEELTVMKDIILRESTVLTIDASDKNILHISKESALPWAVGQFELVLPCANVVNVVWKFSKPGISFQTTDAIYTSTKAGATVAFTENGIKMDGIKKASNEKRTPGQELTVGMTKEQVKQIAGSPQGTFQRVRAADGVFEEAWEYADHTLWFDEKGKLTRIQK